MDTRKTAATLLLGWLALLTVVSAHGFEFFAANRYDELAALPGSSLAAPSGLVSGTLHTAVSREFYGAVYLIVERNCVKK